MSYKMRAKTRVMLAGACVLPGTVFEVEKPETRDHLVQTGAASEVRRGRPRKATTERAQSSAAE